MASDNFSIEKKISLVLILAVILQIGGSVWWAATTDNRMKQLEKNDYGRVIERMVAVEVKIDQAADNFGYSRSKMDELSSKVDMLLANKKEDSK